VKKLLLILTLLLSLTANSQLDLEHPFHRRENHKLVLKEHGWFTISLGTTILASSYYIHLKHGKESGVDKRVRAGGLIFSTTIGVGLHVISWKLAPKKSNPKFL
jgi:hypothetical protein